jgi:Tfp pilus assembly protein PilP
MKSSKVILALWLGASAWAQTLPQKQQVNPAVAPNAARVASAPAPSPKTPAPAATTNSGAPAKTQAVQGKQVAAPATASAAQPTAKPAADHPRTVATSTPRTAAKHAAPTKYMVQPTFRRHGKKKAAPEAEPKSEAVKVQRDPFVSPVVERFRTATACTGSGKQCLVIGEISLHGVVSSPGGFIAVVMNGDHTYFLRENDPLADGEVERITKDAIILRERTSDFLGRPSTREVTKKLGVPAV